MQRKGGQIKRFAPFFLACKIMKNEILMKILRLITSISPLVLLIGCSGGGGSGAFGSGGESLFSSVSGGSSVVEGGSVAIALVHHPEPSSLLLLGSGLASLAMFRRLRPRRRRSQ